MLSQLGKCLAGARRHSLIDKSPTRRGTRAVVTHGRADDSDLRSYDRISVDRNNQRAFGDFVKQPDHDPKAAELH
jgi:hypothetical protein